MQLVREDDKSPSPVTDDAWIRTACEVCRNHCGILAHRVNGEIVKIEGDPQNPKNYGRICAKGNSGMLYRIAPFRVTTPLKRTNPKKGLNEDPKWVPISWEEALDTITDKITEIRDRKSVV